MNIPKASEIPEFNPEDLNPQQLVQVKKGLDEEIQILSSSYTQLNMAMSKFKESERRLGALDSSDKEKDILVPMTSALYMPAKLGDVSQVMVEVGADYFIQDTIPKARDYCSRKIKAVADNMTNITQIIQKKRKQQDNLILVLQVKMKEYEKQQLRAQAAGEAQAAAAMQNMQAKKMQGALGAGPQI